MALNTGNIYQSLIQSRASGGFTFAGVNFDRLALGLALGLNQWAIAQPNNISLNGISSGTLGVGIINPATTKITIPVNIGLMYAALSSSGVVGPLAQSLSIVITQGICQAFSVYGQYSGTSGIVGSGVDNSKISIVNSASLMGILFQTVSSTLGGGPALPQMVTGLSNGISALLLTGSGVGAVTGTPSPSSGQGSTFSVVV